MFLEKIYTGICVQFLVFFFFFFPPHSAHYILISKYFIIYLIIYKRMFIFKMFIYMFFCTHIQNHTHIHTCPKKLKSICSEVIKNALPVYATQGVNDISMHLIYQIVIKLFFGLLPSPTIFTLFAQGKTSHPPPLSINPAFSAV